jgi:hypothetical protein
MMDGAHPRSCGHFVVATLVAFALATSLSVWGATAASATDAGAAQEGAKGEAGQTTREFGVIHQARPAKANSTVNVCNAAPAASLRVIRDHHVSWIQPLEGAVIWTSRTTSAALGRAPPA